MKANGNCLNARKGKQLSPTSNARKLKMKISLHQGHASHAIVACSLLFYNPLEDETAE